jgi:hypothetical protein
LFRFKIKLNKEILGNYRSQNGESADQILLSTLNKKRNKGSSLKREKTYASMP